MPSSTSNSSPEWKVVVSVLAFVALWELASSLSAPFLGEDREHIHSFPEISERLAASDRQKVLVLGNSLTKWGVDGDLLREEMNRHGGRPVDVAVMHPVGTDVVDWNYILRTYCLDVHRNPDLVVIGFVAHHVPDLPVKRHRRLGGHFTAWSNRGELFEHALTNFDDRVENVLSGMFSCMGDQLVWSEGVLTGVVPGFRGGLRQLNHFHEGAAQRPENGRAPPKTYHRLARLMSRLRDAGIVGVFVAMPLPEIWDLDPKIEETAREAGMTFLDARSIEGLAAEDFQDGYHLGETGTRKYTAWLAEALRASIR